VRAHPRTRALSGLLAWAVSSGVAAAWSLTAEHEATLLGERNPGLAPGETASTASWRYGLRAQAASVQPHTATRLRVALDLAAASGTGAQATSPTPGAALEASHEVQGPRLGASAGWRWRRDDTQDPLPAPATAGGAAPSPPAGPGGDALLGRRERLTAALDGTLSWRASERHTVSGSAQHEATRFGAGPLPATDFDATTLALRAAVRLTERQAASVALSALRVQADAERAHSRSLTLGWSLAVMERLRAGLELGHIDSRRAVRFRLPPCPGPLGLCADGTLRPGVLVLESLSRTRSPAYAVVVAGEGGERWQWRAEAGRSERPGGAGPLLQRERLAAALEYAASPRDAASLMLVHEREQPAGVPPAPGARPASGRVASATLGWTHRIDPDLTLRVELRHTDQRPAGGVGASGQRLLLALRWAPSR
jgi:hypothetical protein